MCARFAQVALFLILGQWALGLCLWLWDIGPLPNATCPFCIWLLLYVIMQSGLAGVVHSWKFAEATRLVMTSNPLWVGTLVSDDLAKDFTTNLRTIVFLRRDGDWEQIHVGDGRYHRTCGFMKRLYNDGTLSMFEDTMGLLRLLESYLVPGLSSMTTIRFNLILLLDCAWLATVGSRALMITLVILRRLTGMMR